MADEEQRRLGRYVLLAKLATGGMAEIHLARQTGIEGFERLVVIKKILPHLASEKRFYEMFLDEARITVKLNHPNIVQTYDLGQEGDQYFLAMEYLEGESLGYLAREAHRSGKWLSTALAGGIVASLADGLAYAHGLSDENGQPMHIVHRDVSPQNIIVLFNGGVKLVDFGIAKAATKVHQTRVGTLKGKLAYMAPEQCAGKQVDHRADIFSLGAVLWELLARRRLFKRDNEAAILGAILQEDPPPLRELRPEVPAVLEAVALRALAKRPEDRFQDCAEMAAAIRDHLRRSQSAVGPAEMAEFVQSVFAERARTKKKLLEDIRSADGKDVSLEILKPETTGSLPSRSVADGPAEPAPAGSIEDQATQTLAQPAVEPAHQPPGTTGVRPTGAGPGKRRPVVGLAAGLLVGLAALAIVALWPEPPAAAPTLVEARAAETPLATDPIPDPDPVEAPSSRLRIESTPAGCRVEVDSVKVPGTTPLEDVLVSPGEEHGVVVSCQDHEPEQKTVVAGAGQTVTLAFSPKKPPRSGPATGLLRLDTDPWTEVYLRKRKLGITPLMGIRLPSGKHQLTLINPEAGLRKTLLVTIRPGKTTTLARKLSK